MRSRPPRGSTTKPLQRLEDGQQVAAVDVVQQRLLDGGFETLVEGLPLSAYLDKLDIEEVRFMADELCRLSPGMEFIEAYSYHLHLYYSTRNASRGSCPEVDDEC